MTQLTEKREHATPGASSQNIAQRLQALAQRPQALTVHKVIDSYMSQYAGRDCTRNQRLSAWLAMIGDFTLEQVDSDLIHAGRAELATKPPLVFMGLDHLGQQIFKIKSRAKAKSTATLNRYMVAIHCKTLVQRWQRHWCFMDRKALARIYSLRHTPGYTASMRRSLARHSLSRATTIYPKSGSYPVAGKTSGGLNGPRTGAILSLT
jgi:hypothetical protein